MVKKTSPWKAFRSLKNHKLTKWCKHVMQIILINKTISILVDHVEGLFELCNLCLVEHGKHIGGGTLCSLFVGATAACGLAGRHDSVKYNWGENRLWLGKIWCTRYTDSVSRNLKIHFVFKQRKITILSHTSTHNDKMLLYVPPKKISPTKFINNITNLLRWQTFRHLRSLMAMSHVSNRSLLTDN